jgi:hypothetical protein
MPVMSVKPANSTGALQRPQRDYRALLCSLETLLGGTSYKRLQEQCEEQLIQWPRVRGVRKELLPLVVEEFLLRNLLRRWRRQMTSVKKRVKTLEKKRGMEQMTITIAGVTLQGTRQEIYNRIVAAAAKQGRIPGAPPRNEVHRDAS